MRKGPYRCPSGRRSGPRLRHLRGRHTGAEAGPDGTEPALAGPGWLVAAEEYSTGVQVLRDNHRVCRRAGGRRRDAQAACAALITAGVEHESARRMAGFVRRATLTHDWNERQCRAGGADVFPERRPPPHTPSGSVYRVVGFPFGAAESTDHCEMCGGCGDPVAVVPGNGCARAAAGRWRVASAHTPRPRRRWSGTG